MNSNILSAITRKVMMSMTMTIMSLCILSVEAAATDSDTTWSVSFRLNMTKAVNQHIFTPDSDYVSLIMDNFQPVKLVAGPGYTYTTTLSDLLDSSVTYNYKFRINTSLNETVSRSFKPQPGMVNLSNWWNDEAINTTTFVVNMQYPVQFGWFNPLTDSVRIMGTMNNMQGSPKMGRVGTSLNYSYDYNLDPGTIQQYKYRINLGDSTKGQQELFNQPDRMIRIPDTLLEVSSDYYNYNPAKRLMTFLCDMGYYVKANHFEVSTDYLDVAGNFNNAGGNDVMFDTDGDTIYSLDKYMDTAWIRQGPLTFKFRINGEWSTAELEGKANRSYAFHDTINQNPNIFTCHYNNLDPAIPTPPWVYNVDIQGLLIYKKFLSGMYSYENVNYIPEGLSAYRWLRSSNALGTGATPIDSAVKITYTVDTLDIGKWLVFEVTPHAAKGDSAIGKPVRVVSSNSISAWDVGMDDHSGLIARVYPNPASDYITIESKKEIDRIELVNLLDQPVLVKEGINSKTIRLAVGNLPRGIYFLRAVTRSMETGVARVIRD